MGPMNLISGAVVELTGFAVALCITVAFLPQTRAGDSSALRSRDPATHLPSSLGGCFLWLVYGLRTGSKPVIVSNIFTIVLSLSILFLKLCYDPRSIEEVKL